MCARVLDELKPTNARNVSFFDSIKIVFSDLSYVNNSQITENMQNYGVSNPQYIINADKSFAGMAW